MRKSILIAAAAVTVTVWTAKADETATIQAYIAPVCAANVVLSAKAQAACAGDLGKLKMLKDGTRLRNVGVGTEFNTLLRQIKAGKI